MSKSKLEYIWLDGYKPTQSLRSKTKVVSDFDGKLSSCPMWSFDGSSTLQAPGGSSDCLLKPVAIYPDPERKNGFLVMTEVLNADCTLTSQTEEQLLMIVIMTFGLVSNKNISFGILRLTYLLDSQKIKLLKDNSIVQLEVQILLDVK